MRAARSKLVVCSVFAMAVRASACTLIALAAIQSATMDGSDIQLGESLRRHFRRPLPRLACGVRCWSVFGTDTLWSQLATAAAHLKTLITHSLSSHITSHVGIALDSLVLPVYPAAAWIHPSRLHTSHARSYTLRAIYALSSAHLLL